MDQNELQNLLKEMHYIFRIGEKDPIFLNSPASQITIDDINRWNNKSNFSGLYEDLQGRPDEIHILEAVRAIDVNLKNFVTNVPIDTLQQFSIQDNEMTIEDWIDLIIDNFFKLKVLYIGLPNEQLLKIENTQYLADKVILFSFFPIYKTNNNFTNLNELLISKKEQYFLIVNKNIHKLIILKKDIEYV